MHTRYSRASIITGATLTAILLGVLPAHAVNVTLAGDSFTQATAATKTKGTKKTIELKGPSGGPIDKRGWVIFDLSTLPPGTTAANISHATLTVFANKVSVPGSFDIVRVAGVWDEATITFAGAPALGVTEQSSVAVTTANAFVAADVTAVVQDWVDGSLDNNGLVLVPSAVDGLDARFDSKESKGTSQPPRLEITLVADLVNTSDMVDGAVTNPKLGADAVTSDKIADFTVGTDDLASASVTNSKLAANAVTSDKITDGTVGTNDLADGSVTNPKLAANAVTSDKITDGTVDTADVANGSLLGIDIADGTLTGADIGDGSLTGADIGDGSLTGADITGNTITAGHLTSSSVFGVHVADGSVSGADIADGSLTGSDIAANSISGGHIVDNSVSTNDITNGTITSADIDINSVQVRVGGFCATGDAIQSINNNGSVNCGTSFLWGCASYATGTGVGGGTSCPDTDGVGDAWDPFNQQCALSCPAGKVLVSGGGRCFGTTWLASSFTYTGSLWEVGCINGAGVRSAPAYYNVYCCNQ